MQDLPLNWNKSLIFSGNNFFEFWFRRWICPILYANCSLEGYSVVYVPPKASSRELNVQRVSSESSLTICISTSRSTHSCPPLLMSTLTFIGLPAASSTALLSAGQFVWRNKWRERTQRAFMWEKRNSIPCCLLWNYSTLYLWAYK